ncbi:hypothetical protein [Peribacillus asahii]|uniref:hypothetical protein n=1 Tax=Peribacillus asahii TaxID=228899 RepID=UPI003817302F
MTILNVHSHATAKTDIFYLLNGHMFGEDKRDISVILDRDDALDFIKSADSSLYDIVAFETEGDYFIVTSSVQDEKSELYVENARTTDGRAIAHEGWDILILPHYVPQDIKDVLIDNDKVVIELALESIYEKLVEIIDKK